MTHSTTLLTDIGLGIIFAALLAHVARVLRQPLILGYVVGGALLGSHLGLGLIHDKESIELIAEIGLILLLFIIGLEINLRDLLKMGKSMFTLGIVQFVGCVLAGWAFFQSLGFSNHGGRFDLLYLSVALSLSSTLIVVKLLHDKFETTTAAGRLTIGILVLQDLWAIMFMAFQPNLQHPQAGPILVSFAQGAVLVGLAFLASRYILERLFHAAGKFPELVLITSMAWCFLICGLADYAGLSKEMGALIAGVSIAAFPYGTDVIAKVSGIRDFFVTLFFVALGLKVPWPSWSQIGLSAVILLFVVVSRIVTMVPITVAAGLGARVGLLTSFNLSQISEFSLVILTLGAGYGHVSESLQALVLTAMLLMAVVSTYLILFNHDLSRVALKMFGWLGYREAGGVNETGSAAHKDQKSDLVLLGCFREGEALLEAIDREAPDLKPRILVVDYNPALKGKLESRGYRWVYGDLAHPQTLRHQGIEHASVILCTISDTFLKGTNNLRLLSHLKRLAPRAKLLMTADDPEGENKLTVEGAHGVVVPPHVAGEHWLTRLREAVNS